MAKSLSGRTLRLGTWNCPSGLAANWGILEELDVDVVTVQECNHTTVRQARDHGWSCGWLPGPGASKGLAVLARAPFEITDHSSPEPFFIAATIEGGPMPFTFVGFWAMDPAYAGGSYVQQGTRLIGHLAADGLPVVVAGDFNAEKSKGHLRNVEALRELGLVSAYHQHRGLEHTEKEPEPTYFWRWKEDQPFHCDFVFVPATWPIESVTVGTFDDYIGRRHLSDHVRSWYTSLVGPGPNRRARFRGPQSLPRRRDFLRGRDARARDPSS